MKKLSENVLMTGIPAEVVCLLEKKAKRFECQADETLFNEGDPGDELYLLESGVLQILKKFQADRVILLDELKEGDFVGELALLDRQGRSGTAKAISRVTGWMFDGSVLDILLSKGKEVALPFLKAISSRMRQVDSCFIQRMEASERIVLLGNMVASIAHDLKNPLAAMRMSAELLEMKAQDEKNKKILDLLLQQIDRLTAMIHDLVEFARDKIELKKTVRKLDDIAGQCRDFFAESCRNAGIELVVSLNAPRSIEVDSGKLERVFLNLIKNSIQALKEAKGGRITLETSQTAQQTRIQVSDNGPGVPEDIRNLLFEPFVTRGKKNGVGLGLSIVRKIVEAHGGKTTCQTETGKGTAFQIVLPG